MVADPQPGQRVRANCNIWDDGQNHHPPGYLCLKGDVLFVREVDKRSAFILYVSHKPDSRETFQVNADELDSIEEAHDVD